MSAERPDETESAIAERDAARLELVEAREEFASALRRHRDNELHLAKEVREAQRQVMQARDTIAHMERSRFWRARLLWVRLRGRG
jgi:hypothetical protein